MSVALKQFGYVLQVSRVVDESDFQKLTTLLSSNQRRVPLLRIGGLGDGSYLIPDILDSIDACFSPGVGDSINFEAHLLKKGIPSYLIDASIEKLPLELPRLHFQRKYLGMWTDNHVITLEDWISKNATNDSKLILQMDIEGAEYGVLLASGSEVLRQFRVMVIEFHQLGQVMSPSGFTLVYSTFERLLKDFYIVHLHPNNAGEVYEIGHTTICSVIEITFLRKDLFLGEKEPLLIPHPLDRKNVSNRPDVELDSHWFS